MPARVKGLPPAAVKRIVREVDNVFDRLAVRFLGPRILGKQIYVNWNEHFSIPGLFERAAKEEGVSPNPNTLNEILEVASGYLDAQRERTKARVIREVNAFLVDSNHKKVRTDLDTALAGKLSEIWSETASNVRRIADTEANYARNVGTLEGIVKVNAVAGVDDPVVYFIPVRDQDLCDECRNLHLRRDGATPRVWRLSEVGSGYHKKGEGNPKVGGLHPNCRCVMATLMLGYGFNKAGAVTYIGRSHNEFEEQRENSEGSSP